MNEAHQKLTQEVQNYWNQASCGTEYIKDEKFSSDYFQHIEEHRYTIEPEIFSFAQFTRFCGKKILEVGVGAGTDFVQWVRAGAQAYGIDLTEESLLNTKIRLDQEGLRAYDLQRADAQQLPYPDNMFDCVYSWGVIHHAPDTKKCLKEIIRVTKPGGVIKLMIYNRYSLFAFYRWILEALCTLKPFRSISWVLYHHQESKGTKAYTRKEIIQLLKHYPVTIEILHARVTQHDLLYYKANLFRWIAYLSACLLGMNRVGWFMTIQLRKHNT